MPTRHSHTLSRAHHPQSGRRGLKLVLQQLHIRRIPQCTSASTRPCYTMRSMAILAHSTSATSTDLLCSCTRFSEILPTRTAQLFSGATLTRGVSSSANTSMRSTNNNRSRQCRMYLGLLHGAHPVMAAASCSSTHCANGPSLHAFP
jgi:hypothetical protein